MGDDNFDNTLVCRAIGGAGFFCNCARRLTDISRYFNKNEKIPLNVCSKKLFRLFKDSKEARNRDITFDYFKHYKDVPIDIKFSEKIDFDHPTQWYDYDYIKFNLFTPFIKKYFSLSDEIIKEYDFLKTEYNVDFENTCVLLYRGNDKKKETRLCSYEDFLIRANKILKENRKIKFLLQSDETEFIEFFREKFPNNSFVFEDKIRHISKHSKRKNVERGNRVGTNYTFAKYYLAITYLMSKCKHLICQSGNTSLWVVLYRETEHLKNTHIYYGKYNRKGGNTVWKEY